MEWWRKWSFKRSSRQYNFSWKNSVSRKWESLTFETVSDLFLTIEKNDKNHTISVAYRDDTVDQYNIKDFNINDSLVFSNFD